jgi:hypothetical protein
MPLALAVIIMTSNLRVAGILEILSQVKEKISHRGGECQQQFEMSAFHRFEMSGFQRYLALFIDGWLAYDFLLFGLFW